MGSSSPQTPPPPINNVHTHMHDVHTLTCDHAKRHMPYAGTQCHPEWHQLWSQDFIDRGEQFLDEVLVAEAARRAGTPTSEVPPVPCASKIRWREVTADMEE
jgi:hypothetical protein